MDFPVSPDFDFDGPPLPEPKAPKSKPAHGPEWHIEKRLMGYLEEKGWWVGKLQGNMYQSGWPDLYIHHLRHGARWIDVKVEGRYSFTAAQRLTWPRMEEHGIGIWIITGADQSNYDKLFGPPNWRQYWKASYGELPDLDDLLDKVRLDS